MLSAEEREEGKTALSELARRSQFMKNPRYKAFSLSNTAASGTGRDGRLAEVNRWVTRTYALTYIWTLVHTVHVYVCTWIQTHVLYICTYMDTNACTVHMYIHGYKRMYCTYVHTWIQTHVLYICTYMDTNACTVHMYIHGFICTVHTYVHTWIHYY